MYSPVPAMLWINVIIVIAIGLVDVYGYYPLSDQALKTLSFPSQQLDLKGSLFSSLFVPRVSSTPGNTKVREFIVEHFVQLGWHIELDSFTETTPFGTKNFTNIIVTKNPDATHKLVLAAHYDSKYFPGEDFIGAVDSAVSCGILMDIATSLDAILIKQTRTLQMIFFDGEEAWIEWSATDSIYGARHLAATWSNASPEHHTLSRLNQIELFVLLDLLGTKNPRIHNYYQETNHLFYSLVDLERRLDRLSLLERVAKDGSRLKPVFHPGTPMTFQGHAIGDDHLPFLERGVRVLHIIPFPFPFVWHNSKDTPEHVDPGVVHNFAILFRAFTVEYLESAPLLHTEL
ncbi:hypothetical protein BDF14DRAFT_573318 [Spinellus fusiger]|nr:hypothetical protein BDF14DRAFT_573318 [Spinellus fusiger]